jgi:hypothetical protein
MANYTVKSIYFQKPKNLKTHYVEDVMVKYGVLPNYTTTKNFCTLYYFYI